MKVKVTLSDKALNRQIDRALKTSPKEAGRAMMDCVLDLAGESASRAPVESGDLRDNCHGAVGGATVFQNQTPTAAPITTMPKLVGEVGYSLPYALRQHEDLSLDHDRSDGKERRNVVRYTTTNGEVFTSIGDSSVNMVAGGEAKFLERPFEERTPRYIDRFARVVEDTLK